MKKETLVKKLVSAVLTTALVASLAISYVAPVEAAAVTFKPWSFFQTGTTTDAWNNYEICAYSGVTFGDSGVAALTATDFPFGDGTGVGFTEKVGSEVTATAKGVSTAFDATIISNGWSAAWSPDGKLAANNPYTLQAFMDGVVLEYGHQYTITYKAKATKTKYATFTVVDNDTNTYFAEDMELGTEDTVKTATFVVENDMVKTVKFNFQFGAYLKVGEVVKAEETNWAGTVSISDFAIVDNGLVLAPVVDPDKGGNDSVTTAPTVKKPAKAKIKKVYTKKKASKKLKVKIYSASGAKAYQYQVSKSKSFKSKNLLIKKKYSSKKTITLSSSKLKNKSKLYVRVRGYVKDAKGNKVFGDWSKAKKAKIK